MNKHDVMKVFRTLDNMTVENSGYTVDEITELRKILPECYYGNDITTASVNVTEFFRKYEFNVETNDNRWKISCPYRFGTNITLFAVVGTTDKGVTVIAGWKYDEKTEEYKIILSNSFRIGMEMTFVLKGSAENLLNSINNKEFSIYYDDSDSKNVDFNTFKIKELSFID